MLRVTPQNTSRGHTTLLCDSGNTGNIIKNTMHYRQAMPHNTISPALFVSRAVGLEYVTVWT